MSKEKLSPDDQVPDDDSTHLKRIEAAARAGLGPAIHTLALYRGVTEGELVEQLTTEGIDLEGVLGEDTPDS